MSYEDREKMLPPWWAIRHKLLFMSQAVISAVYAPVFDRYERTDWPQSQANKSVIQMLNHFLLNHFLSDRRVGSLRDVIAMNHAGPDGLQGWIREAQQALHNFAGRRPSKKIHEKANKAIEGAAHVLGDELTAIEGNWRFRDCLRDHKASPEVADAFAAAWEIGQHRFACNMVQGYMREHLGLYPHEF